MWILSSDGDDFLQGKRVWLKPGKKYLFGRVKRNGVRHAIDNATISRQHLVIEVGHVKSGDGVHVHAKSKLVLTDQKTTCGTIVDGESIKGSSKELKKDEHVIQIGKYPHALRINWYPIVLTFSVPSKIKDPLKHAVSSLEDLDIKTIIPYVVDKTTHVVQSKRNTAKGLQALINGKYIVHKSYIEAIVYAATPSDLESEEALCPLEEDFDAAWPDPAHYLPPRSKEPTKRPDTSYEPNPGRLTVFEGYTFIFCDANRFEDLQGPITNGHGKALLYGIERGRTTAEDIVNYMKQVAGQKGLGDFDGSGGVGLVQFRKADELGEWDAQIENRVASITGQNIIETSQFLDAILGNDASSLFQPHPREGRPSAVSHERADEQPRESQALDDEPTRVDVSDTQAASQPVKRSRTRTFVSKFKAFDDGFDMDSIPAYTLEEGDRSEEISQAMVPDSLPEQPQTNQPLSDEDEIVSELLPGAAAMKRLASSRKRGKSTPPPAPPQKPKKPKLNVMEAARQRRQAVDEAAMQQQEQEVASFRAMTESVEVEKLRNLAIVEEMAVPDVARERTGATDDGRYDERWNGRKNFKKFRRKGHDDVTLHRAQAVIVPLEEAKRKDFGLGETYWSTSQPRSNRLSVVEPSQETPVTSQPAVRTTRTKSPTPPVRTGKRLRNARDSESDDELRFRFRRRKGR
ncbi:hypothetical protein AJ79_09399 [Helicocarpus griseus UAMH5409]|uniref:FHA domain-containing protein n=1 Tax=Helicocarpus griseus UAMH5409 TaxID=1447875 RepID=A0A2B7WK66_9EURO|nr:hypothetical protein AJ79_09399 [Helicocarpus griseus UAMH5409]